MTHGLQPLLVAALAVATAAVQPVMRQPLPATEHAEGVVSAFHGFMQKHGRQYAVGSEEYSKRLTAFSKHMAEAEEHNKQPNKLWTAGVNHLSDWHDEELKKLRGWKGMASRSRGSGGSQPHTALLSQTSRVSVVPNEFTWSNLSSLAAIRDQGACGSCWAVATATVLQAHAEIAAGKPVPEFSAQELVSCVANPHHCGGAGGCDGATAELAFNYIMQNGLLTESAEPYQAFTGVCQRSNGGNVLAALRGSTDKVVSGSTDDLTEPGIRAAPAGAAGLVSLGMQGWQRLPENQYEPLMLALVERGPVAISVSADYWASYVGGIFDSCNPDAVIDHAVVLIGYGKDSDLSAKYWLVQNSWGQAWGENGRIRLLRQDPGAEAAYCGIDRQPEMGTGCDGGPSAARVCGMCGILYDNVVPLFGSL